jgi:rhodanese-related sulfurtransferase
MYRTIDSARLRELLDTVPRPQLVDVRTAAEVARGSIVGAQHIELATLPTRSVELDPASPCVLFCQSGGRSAQACAYLAQRGFGQLYSLEGGVSAWTRAGLPLSTQESA